MSCVRDCKRTSWGLCHQEVGGHGGAAPCRAADGGESSRDPLDGQHGGRAEEGPCDLLPAGDLKRTWIWEDLDPEKITLVNNA